MANEIRIEIRIMKRADSDLDRITHPNRDRIATAIEALREAPLNGKLLQGKHQGLRTLRVGNYRVLYTYDAAASEVIVAAVRHRSRAYRGRAP